MECEVAGRLERERTCVHLWLIRVDVWQKPAQYCKPIILQLKINENVAWGEVEQSNKAHLQFSTNSLIRKFHAITEAAPLTHSPVPTQSKRGNPSLSYSTQGGLFQAKWRRGARVKSNADGAALLCSPVRISPGWLFSLKKNPDTLDRRLSNLLLITNFYQTLFDGTNICLSLE